MEDVRLLTGYKAAIERAAYWPVDGGYLEIAGETRIDFIQRQTTNDLQLLSRDRAVSTVLTSSVAKILDILLAIDAGDRLGIVTLPGCQSQTAHYLQSRIFFMDRVVVSDASDRWTQLWLVGPLAKDLLPLSASVDHLCEAQIDGIRVKTILCQLASAQFHLVMTGASNAADVKVALEKRGIPLLSSNEFEMVRIEAGWPAVGHELTENFTPLEASLTTAISGSKGCYTGQEIIARQITYDKVVQRLAGLRLGRPVTPGDSITADGRQAGQITSATVSPRFGPIGLGYVRRPHDVPGCEVIVLNAKGEVSGKVSDLPFSN